MKPGSTVGPYVVEREIGSGGMGVVFRARDARLSRTIALKVLPETTDPERLLRFEREARILAALEHPNIAGIHSLEQVGGERFLALEYVAGESLAQRLARGALPPAESLDVCRQVAAALEAAHEAGIVHRDLKPGNVMLTPSGQVKVLDFGLARMDEPLGAGGDSDARRAASLTMAATQVGVVLGTAAYMSPEQARGRPTDKRTDIWSFGCVLYECLTGRQAFAGETISDSIARILEREPDFDALPGATPAAVRDLLVRCLEKDSRQRLRDVGEARWALEQALAARTASGRLLVAGGASSAGAGRAAGSTPASAAGMAARARGLAPLAAVAVVAVAAGLAAGAAWLARGRPEPLRCVAITFPPEYSVRGSTLLPDGSALTAGVVPRQPDASGQAPPRLILRTLGSFEFRTLPQTIGFVNSWSSSDSRRLLLLMPAGPGMAQRRLLTMPLDGASPPAPLADWRDEWIGAAWLPDGDVLVTDGPTSFVRIDGRTGAVSASKPIVVEGGGRVSSIELPPPTLPGSDHALVNVVSYDERGWHYAVGLLALSTGRARVLIDDGGNGFYSPRQRVLYFARGHTLFAARFDAAQGRLTGAPAAVWSGLRTTTENRPGSFRVLDDGSLYYAPGGAGEGRSLAVIDPAGNLAPLPIDRRTIEDAPVVAPDGRRFACAIANGRGIDEVWLGALDRPDLTRLGTDPNADCTLGCWSPDGTTLAYKRLGRDKDDGLYVQPVAGGAARCVWRVGVTDTVDRASSFTADGRALLVWRSAHGHDGLWRLALAGDAGDRARLVPLFDAGANRRGPHVSRDGRWLAYVSDETGRFESYLAPLASDGTPGRPVQLTSTGSFGNQWAPDGHALYVADVRNRVFAVRGLDASNAGVPADARPLVDLDKLDLASCSALDRGRFLVALRSRDESPVTSYQLVQGFAREAERRLRGAG